MTGFDRTAAAAVFDAIDSAILQWHPDLLEQLAGCVQHEPDPRIARIQQLVIEAPAGPWEEIEFGGARQDKFIRAIDLAGVLHGGRVLEQEPFPFPKGVRLNRDDALTAAVAIRESTLNEAMGFLHRQHLLQIAERLERAS